MTYPRIELHVHLEHLTAHERRLLAECAEREFRGLTKRDWSLPGRRAGIGYLWFIIVSPIVLLLMGGALVGVGLWRHVDGVAIIGAVAVVGSLILPRTQGAFKLGPGGVEGDVEGDVFRRIIERSAGLAWAGRWAGLDDQL